MESANTERSWADVIELEGSIDFLTTGIFDLADYARHVEHVLGNLAGHDVGIITIAHSDESIGFFDASSPQYILIYADADNRRAFEFRPQTSEGLGPVIDNGNIMIILIEHLSEQSAQPTTSNNYYAHCIPPRA